MVLNRPMQARSRRGFSPCARAPPRPFLLPGQHRTTKLMNEHLAPAAYHVMVATSASSPPGERRAFCAPERSRNVSDSMNSLPSNHLPVIITGECKRGEGQDDQFLVRIDSDCLTYALAEHLVVGRTTNRVHLLMESDDESVQRQFAELVGSLVTVTGILTTVVAVDDGGDEQDSPFPWGIVVTVIMPYHHLLLQQVFSADPQQRCAALDELQQRYRRVSHVVVMDLAQHDYDRDMRLWTWMLIAKLPQQVTTDEVVAALSEPDDAVRRVVVEILQGKSDVPLLLWGQLMADTNPAIATMARSIWQVRHTDETGV